MSRGAGGPLVPYRYIVLRLLPCPEREEFLNIGVVLECEGLVLAETVIAEQRVLALDPQLDLDALQHSLQAIHALVDGRTGRSPLHSPASRFEWIARPRATAVQPGPLRTGLTLDPHTEIARLVAALVLPAAAIPDTLGR